MLIFEQSRTGRVNTAQQPAAVSTSTDIPTEFLRDDKPLLPEVSEMQAVRHYTRLSTKNFSIDTHFYPLGSCTMKYNPRGCNTLSMLPGFLNRHPDSPANMSQGFLSCMYDLQEILKDVTGMKEVSLSPMAGAQGEFAGVAMIRAYHDAKNGGKGDPERTEILVPDAAHGTNPATATMCNYKVREIPTNSDGDVDIEALKEAVGPQTAGIMLTNPSTLGVFERKIKEIADIVHKAGGLLYYDGANLNAILGKVKPGDMGFDVIHMNLHKTFSTPHGGGGPGATAAALATRSRAVGVIATPATVRSHAYFEAIKEEDPFVEIYEHATPELVPLVEDLLHLGREAEVHQVAEALHQAVGDDVAHLLRVEAPVLDPVRIECLHDPDPGVRGLQDVVRLADHPLALLEPAAQLGRLRCRFAVQRGVGELPGERLDEVPTAVAYARDMQAKYKEK